MPTRCEQAEIVLFGHAPSIIMKQENFINALLPCLVERLHFFYTKTVANFNISAHNVVMESILFSVASCRNAFFRFLVPEGVICIPSVSNNIKILVQLYQAMPKVNVNSSQTQAS